MMSLCKTEAEREEKQVFHACKILETMTGVPKPNFN
jgi:hypothetical protein